jgi:hypothetical protein
MLETEATKIVSLIQCKTDLVKQGQYYCLVLKMKKDSGKDIYLRTLDVDAIISWVNYLTMVRYIL